VRPGGGADPTIDTVARDGRPAISVVIPARDAATTIMATLESLAAQRVDQQYEVIVVDNGSVDQTGNLAETAGVRVIRRGRGEGPGAARNAGAAAARADLLAFTDSDAVPEPDWLASGLRALQDADLVQGAVHPDPGASAGPFDRSLWVTEESGLYETANLLVRRELFERLGGFGPGLEGAGGEAPFGEDVVFGWRARRAGARTAFAPDARVHHAVAARSARDLLAECERKRHFPALARDVPELREAFFYRRYFLSRRSAAFAGAIAAAAAAAIARSPWPVLAASPYVGMVARDIARAPKWGAVRAVSDAVSFAALLRGSLAARTLLL
jgi:glycosyltransferase involved in cell wall biosynthesis